MAKKAGILLIAIGFIVTLFLITALGYWSPTIIPPPPPPPGNEPEVTYKTEVLASFYWFQTPEIKSVRSSQLITSVSSQPFVLLFPFEGTIVLQVDYPSGQSMVVGSQRVLIDKGDDVTITFTWKTKQSGKHMVTATMCDLNGNLIDQKTEDVYVPTR
jgi:hypothetical protein